jgi:hypothetical protein
MHSNRFPHPFTDNRTPLSGASELGLVGGGTFHCPFLKDGGLSASAHNFSQGMPAACSAPIFPIRLQGRLAGFVGPKGPHAWFSPVSVQYTCRECHIGFETTPFPPQPNQGCMGD